MLTSIAHLTAHHVRFIPTEGDCHEESAPDASVDEGSPEEDGHEEGREEEGRQEGDEQRGDDRLGPSIAQTTVVGPPDTTGASFYFATIYYLVLFINISLD